MSPQQSAHRASAVFGLYDVDGDDQISGSDIDAYAQRLVEVLGAGDVDSDPLRMPHAVKLARAYAGLWTQLAVSCDTDRDGLISRQEFIAAFDRGAFDTDPDLRRAMAAALDALVEAIDTAGNGVTGRSEYPRLFDAVGLDPGEFMQALQQIDGNDDGAPSRQELRALALHLSPLADSGRLEPHQPPDQKVGLALVAHDARKPDLLAWVQEHRSRLTDYRLYATGTTGGLLAEDLGLAVTELHSGPLGGDQQIGARITEGQIHAIVFFYDPLTSHPHGDDIRALIRLAVLADIPVALNKATADLLVTECTAATNR